jgi:hypothetical protein
VRALTSALWNPDLHPRGRDGKFIEVLGLVRLFGADFTDSTGRSVDLTGRRARVTGIRPDPRSPGQPDIEVALLDRNGQPATKVTVKPRNVLEAPEKARIRERLTPPARRGEDSVPGQEFGPNTPEWNVAPNLKISRAEDDGHRIVVPKTEADMRNYPVESGTAVELRNLQLRRELASEARYMGDKEIARILAQDSEGAWLEAVTVEKQARDRRRAADQARHAAFVNGVNAQVAQVSTTDPAQRYQQLDAMLGRLRWSPLDTDQTFDRLYPPEGGSEWTPERHALHEQMWREIIDKVEAADIPKEHKALVLGGLPGAGKTTILQPGHPAEKFGVTTWNVEEPVPSGATAVSVAPDNVKEMMIDHGMLPPGLRGLSPREQVLMMHEESTYLSNLFQTRLAEQGYNLVLDNMMDDPGRSEKRMAPLAREGYQFQGLFVDIPVEESQMSARQRYLDGFGTPKGGRLVPSTISRAKQSQHGNMSKNRDTFDTIAARKWFTDWMVVDNTGVSQGQPRGEIEAQGTSDGSATIRYTPAYDEARRALDAAGLSEVEPLTRDQFSNPDTPRTRAVSGDEFAALAARGKARLGALRADRETPAVLNGPDWQNVKDEGWAAVQQEWGGATTDVHTGERVTGGDRYAITMRPTGSQTVTVPIGATRDEFDQAMEEARKRWEHNVFTMHQANIGVFRNDDTGFYEIDPVLVVDNVDDVETIGAYAHSSGGAYNFGDGLGYWPPYVAV